MRICDGRTKERKRNFSYLAVMAKRKCGSGISHFWQLKQSVSGEAELQIFYSQGRAEVRKQNFTSLEVPAEMKCGSGPSHLWKSWSKKCRSGTWDLSKSWQNRSLESRISHICQSRQSGSVEAKLQTFRSPGRAKERKLNFKSLAIEAGRKCRSGTSHLRKNWQSRSAERNSCHILRSQDKVEMRKRNFTSLVVNAVWKRNFGSLAVTTERKCRSGTSDLWLSSQDGSAEAELYIFDWPLSCWLSLPVLANNSTDCYNCHS